MVSSILGPRKEAFIDRGCCKIDRDVHVDADIDTHVDVDVDIDIDRSC